MIRKTLLVSFIACLIVFLIGFFLYEINEVDKKYVGQFIAKLILLGFIPMIGMTFIILTGFNHFFSFLFKNKSLQSRKKFYALGFTIITVLPIVGFILYDYFQFNRFGKQGNLLSIIFEYQPFILLSLLVFFLNRKIVWDNFK